MSTVHKWSGGAKFPTIDPETPVRPIYRGPENPTKGIRISCARAICFDWSHDGGPDDIIGYRIGVTDETDVGAATGCADAFARWIAPFAEGGDD